MCRKFASVCSYQLALTASISLTKFCARHIPNICGKQSERNTVSIDSRSSQQSQVKAFSHLQQRDSNEDPSHYRQVVLQPFLKLRHTAFDMNVCLLFCILMSNEEHEIRIKTFLFLTAHEQSKVGTRLNLCFSHHLTDS